MDLVNDHRTGTGCGPLTWHAGAAAVALAHSTDMRDRDFFSHTNPDGESPFDMWINSPGHRANIENCSYTHHGVGLIDGIWTHLFLQNPTA